MAPRTEPEVVAAFAAELTGSGSVEAIDAVVKNIKTAHAGGKVSPESYKLLAESYKKVRAELAKPKVPVIVEPVQSPVHDPSKSVGVAATS